MRREKAATWIILICADLHAAGSGLQRLDRYFEQNVGQADAEVAYILRGSSYTLMLTSGGATLHAGGSVVNMNLMGADLTVRPVGAEPLQTRVNYLIGNDPSLWHLQVPTFSRVEWKNVYPGTDLIYYYEQGEVKYEFV